MFDNSDFVDTGGGSSAESDTVQASLTDLGHVVSTFTQTNAAGITTALSGKDVVLIPEQEEGSLVASLDTSARTAYRDFVSTGGGLVIHGAHANLFGADVLNGIFGFELEESLVDSELSKAPGLEGTEFADDPTTLPALSGTSALDSESLPAGALSIYEIENQSAVALIPFGAGKIVFLGWDWYDAEPLGSENSGWLQVLDSAIGETDVPLDFGDANSPYPTTIAENGARHIPTGPRLGDLRDVEDDAVVDYVVDDTIPNDFEDISGLDSSIKVVFEDLVDDPDNPDTEVEFGEGIPIPTFRFYGRDYSEFFVSPKGYITFLPGQIPGQSVLFFDSFLTTALDPTKWNTTVSNANVDDLGITEPSEPYSARINGNPGNDTLRSVAIDLSDQHGANLVYSFQQAGQGEKAGPGDDLVLEYLNDSGVWVELDRQPGNELIFVNYAKQVVALPADALHANFQFQFRNTGDSGDWFVDDVSLVDPHGLIAGWWENLDLTEWRETPTVTEEGPSVTYNRLGSPARDIIQFTNVPIGLSSESRVTFQIKLFQGDDTIELHYENVPTNGSPVVGIQDYTGRNENPISQVSTDTAVRFTPVMRTDNSPSFGGGLSDEDGFSFAGPSRAGQYDYITVDVQDATPAGAKLDAWIDFNGDGTWGGPGEQIADSVLVHNGDNDIFFQIPPDARPGSAQVRLRLSTLGNLGPKGLAFDGEVEDHFFVIDPPAATAGLFGPEIPIAQNEGLQVALVAADVDGDGDLDLVSARNREGIDRVTWHENDGYGSGLFLHEHTILVTTNRVRDLIASDINGDGAIDVLIASSADNSIAWYENKRELGFVEHGISNSVNVGSLSLGDMDGDGSLDVVAAPLFTTGNITWYKNPGLVGQLWTEAIVGPVSNNESAQVVDIDNDGDLDILANTVETETNQDPNIVTKSIIWYENSNLGFTRHTIDTYLSNQPPSLAATDVDRDGDTDVVAAFFNLNHDVTSDDIVWYENTGAGFNRHIISSDTLEATVVLPADFNGDGIVDVMAAANTGVSLAVFLNDGQENFGEQIIAPDFANPSSAIVADLDVDGDLDLIVTSETNGKIVWFQNDNAGDYGDAPDPYPTRLDAGGARHTATGIMLGASRDDEIDGAPSDNAVSDDVNGDDEDGVTFGTVQVGAIDASVTVDVQGGDGKLDAWIDFNGDGNWGGSGERIFDNLAVTEGMNELNFAVPTWAVAGPTYARFRLSTTGNLPVGGTTFDGEVEDHQVWITAPAGTSLLFENTTIIDDQQFAARSVIAADVNGDGHNDIIAAAGNGLASQITWYENDGTGKFIDEVSQQPRRRTIADDIFIPIDLFPADVDSDGDVDIVAAILGGNQILWYDNNGEGTFTERVVAEFPIVAGPRRVFAADMDGDGDTDLLSASVTNSTIAWYENDGSQNFTPHFITDSALGASSVYAADVDRDGDMDVLGASSSDHKIVWYINNGDQRFTPQTLDDGANSASRVVAVDVDRDGHMDVVAKGGIFPNHDQILWYRNDGTNNFTKHVMYSNPSMNSIRDFTLADFDGDSDFDLLVAFTDQSGSGHEIFRNRGVGDFFFSAVSGSTPAGISSVFAADVDGNGALDALFSYNDGNQIRLRTNDVGFDFGDAPADYPTLLSEGGPSHLATGPTLGLVRDVETDGVPSPGANGDVADEDGVLFLTPLVVGFKATVQVTASGPGFLNAWVDFNQNNIWESEEQIATSKPVQPGTQMLQFDVPSLSGITGPVTYARFRLSSTEALQPTGSADDGEVEDYVVGIQQPLFPDTSDDAGFGFEVTVPPEEIQFFDPAVAIGYDYIVTPGGDNFASIQLLPGFGDDVFTIHLFNESSGTFEETPVATVVAGETFDFLSQVDPGGIPRFRILGIETTANLDPDDPQAFPTGLSFVGPNASFSMVPQATADVVDDNFLTVQDVAVTGNVLLNDTDRNNDPLTASLESPSSPTTGTLDFSSDGTFTFTPAPGFLGDVTFTYRANDGFANSDPATVTITVTDEASDFGDAPAPFPTTLADNGARHQFSATGPRLGSNLDVEADGQPTTPADGDDVAGADDEDGIVLGSLAVGEVDATVSVTVGVATGLLNAWIDFDGNGAWEPAEQILTDVILNPGTHNLPMNVPIWAVPGETYARFRLSTTANLAPVGEAVGGEVEDYRLTINPSSLALLVNTTSDTSAQDNLLTLREAIEISNGTLSPRDALLETHLSLIQVDGQASKNVIQFTTSLMGGTITLGGSELKITNDVTIQGLGDNQLAVSGNHASRIFTIDDGDDAIPLKDVVIFGLTITEGLAIGSNPFFGGGIYNRENLTLTNTTVSSNYAAYAGGGIFSKGSLTITGSMISHNETRNTVAGFGGGINHEGPLHIDNTEISNNVAARYGGGLFAVGNNTSTITNSVIDGNVVGLRGAGIANYQSMDISDTTISNNRITVRVELRGGAGIYNGGSLTLTRSQVTGNRSRNAGGGIMNSTNATQLTITNSTISGNNVNGNGKGGGIYNSAPNVSITNSTISGNRATKTGGGIANYPGGSLSIINSTISGNTGSSDGGGISNRSGTITVLNNTVTGNTSGTGGGGGLANISGTMTVQNSLITGNTTSGMGHEVRNNSGTVNADVFNLFGDISNTYAQAFSGFTPGASDIIATSDDGSGSPNPIATALDAILNLKLADNGGPTFTHALVVGSPAIDTGDPNFMPPPDTDQRGTLRVLDGDGNSTPTLDIGAYEFITLTEVQRVVTDLDTRPGDPKYLPSVGVPTTGDPEYLAAISTVDSLVVNPTGTLIEIKLILGSGDYSGEVVNAPPGTRLTVNGQNKDVIVTSPGELQGIVDQLILDKTPPPRQVDPLEVVGLPSTVDDRVGLPVTNDTGLQAAIAEVNNLIVNHPAHDSVNDIPVAIDDRYTTGTNTPLTLNATWVVLANDTDPDNDTLNVLAINGNAIAVGQVLVLPSGATLERNPDDSFTYTPDTDFTGTDTFTYQANDGVFDSIAATVTIIVGGDAPVASDDSYTMREGESLNVTAGAGVLANDTDPSNPPSPLSVTAINGNLFTGPANASAVGSEVTLPSGATLQLNADGSFTYTPPEDFSGTDFFVYQASDGTAGTSGTVTITVNPIIDIELFLESGDYSGPTLSPPAGTRLIINGENNDVIFEGASPAGSFLGGIVEVIDVTFVNDTPAPTVLIAQGAEVRFSGVTIIGTTGGSEPAVQIEGGSSATFQQSSITTADTDNNQSAIEIEGSSSVTFRQTTITTQNATQSAVKVSGSSSVDLGTTEEPGDNNIQTNGGPVIVNEDGTGDVQSVGNQFSRTAVGSEGTPLTLPIGDVVTAVPGELLTLTFSGDIPAGSIFSVGTDLSDGEAPFELIGISVDQLADVLLAVPGPSEFTLDVTITAGGTVLAEGSISVKVNNLVDFAGRVYNDLNNDGVFDAGESGIAGVTIEVWDQDMTILYATAVTASDGTYVLDSKLAAGTYKIVKDVTNLGNRGLLDGKETAGSVGGSVDNTQDSNVIDNIVVSDSGTTPDGLDYLFAEIEPSDLFGFVWQDFNNDGSINFGELAIDNARITLTGTDDRGNVIAPQDTLSAADGSYGFFNLRPGSYTLTEEQPTGFDDGLDTLGTVNGVASGIANNDQFTAVVLGSPGSVGENYNFGDRPTAEGGVAGSSQTAGIGFWHNKHGQDLIQSLNGGPDSTQLADWLAATFPNLYGDLAGKTNTDVADFFKTLFKSKKKSTTFGGPPKADAQVLATALAVYVTNQNLAGTVAVDFGFQVTTDGVGVKTYNVGDDGEAFGAEDHSDVQILNLLLAVDERSHNGVLYDINGDGDTDDTFETLFRTIANDIFSNINEDGEID